MSDPTRVRDGATADIVADIRYANSTLFDTLRIPWIAGRTFDEHDGVTSPIGVVVSDSLARTLWPGENAIGRALRLELYNGIQGSVVGVVGDVHVVDARTPVRPLAYLSSARFPSGTRDLVVRTSGDPAAIVPSLRSLVAALAPGVPLYQVESMADAVDVTLAPERFTAFVLSAFAVIASLLGGVGVFGVIASDVGRRRKEIGVRMALGATRSTVSWMMLRQTIARAAIGVAGRRGAHDVAGAIDDHAAVRRDAGGSDVLSRGDWHRARPGSGRHAHSGGSGAAPLAARGPARRELTPEGGQTPLPFRDTAGCAAIHARHGCSVPTRMPIRVSPRQRADRDAAILDEQSIAAQVDAVLGQRDAHRHRQIARSAAEIVRARDRCR